MPLVKGVGFVGEWFSKRDGVGSLPTLGGAVVRGDGGGGVDCGVWPPGQWAERGARCLLLWFLSSGL